MELLLFILVLCIFGILAARFGYDTREVPYSKEHELAGYGVVWDVRHARLEDLRHEARVRRIAQEAALPHRGRTVRARLAAGLRALALWLSPELKHSSSEGAATRSA